MALSEGECVSESEEKDENEEYDPRLDFFSDKFDPVLALNTPNVKIPDNNAVRYDNLAIYHTSTDKEKLAIKENTAKKQKAATSKAGEVKRHFLPHQMPVKSERIFKTRNVFTRMEAMKGPLALLRKCKDERLRIKIYTRHAKGIRGYCLGYVTAFDKHWNLALEDVTEFWTRPKKGKLAALDTIPEAQRSTFHVRAPKVKVTPHETNEKLENCTRYVQQFMMRGEHVVTISVVGEEDSSIT